MMASVIYIGCLLAALAVLFCVVTSLAKLSIDYFVDRGELEAAWCCSGACVIVGLFLAFLANEWLANLCGMPA